VTYVWKVRLFVLALFIAGLAISLGACAPRHDDGAGDLWIGVREVLKND